MGFEDGAAGAADAALEENEAKESNEADDSEEDGDDEGVTPMRTAVEQRAPDVKLWPLAARIPLLVAGMFAAAFGISLIAKLELGSTPISSVPLVVTAITGYSFGTTTFLVNLFFVFAQFLLLRKRFSIGNLLQIPSVFVFSLFIDASMAMLNGLPHVNYFVALAGSILGNIILALGILMQVRSKTLVQPGEGVVLALAVTFRKPFGYLKVANDVALVMLAVIVALAAQGEIVQIREGTVISAVIVGLLVKFFDGIRKKITGSP